MQLCMDFDNSTHKPMHLKHYTDRQTTTLVLTKLSLWNNAPFSFRIKETYIVRNIYTHTANTRKLDNSIRFNILKIISVSSDQKLIICFPLSYVS